MQLSAHPLGRRRDTKVILKKLVLGSAAAFFVFAVGSVPPLIYASTLQLMDRFNPGSGVSELVGHSILLAGLYLFSFPVPGRLGHGAVFGALVGLLVSLSELVSFFRSLAAIGSAAATPENPTQLQLWLPIFLAIVLWYVAVWGLAGVAVAWANSKLSDRKAAA